MNKLIGSIVIVAALCFLPGCATPPNANTIRHVATATQIVAKDATFLYVQAHPDARTQFEQAHDALAVIETADAIDFPTVLKIVQTFPIKELKNPTTVMLIQDAQIILVDVGASISLDKVNDLRPIVTALRVGIEQGLQ